MNDESNNRGSCLVFEMGGEAYALRMEECREITEMPPLVVPLPRSPSFLLGMINLRGEIVPVVDPLRLAGVPRRSSPGGGARRRMLVAGREADEVAFVVEQVRNIVRIPDDILEDFEDEGGMAAYAEGCFEDEEGRVVVLLSLARILDDPGVRRPWGR